MITLDIKDMYVNLPIKGILRAAKTWLQKTVNNPETNKQTNNDALINNNGTKLFQI